MNTSTKTPDITFAVSDVKRAETPYPEVPYLQALHDVLGAGGTLEAYAHYTRPVITPALSRDTPATHSFVFALNLAYDRHQPLILSPDMIWLLILQGFALHVNLNAETLCPQLVAHEGKAKLRVRQDEFIKGFAGNDWESVFTGFSEQIRSHIGDSTHELLIHEFSTTNPVYKAAFEITMMEAFQEYFDYSLLTACGIPEITLEGTTEDWEAIYTRAEKLAAFDLSWWIDHLLPALQQFIAASKGEIDNEFWQNFYKLNGQSGGPSFDGNIVNFFPYLVHRTENAAVIERRIATYMRIQGISREQAEQKIHPITSYPPHRNTQMGKRPESLPPRSLEAPRRIETRGMHFGSLPPALSCAPFTWDYRGTELPMEFIAGFVGVAQNPETLALRPEIGWAIRERN